MEQWLLEIVRRRRRASSSERRTRRDNYIEAATTTAAVAAAVRNLGRKTCLPVPLTGREKQRETGYRTAREREIRLAKGEFTRFAPADYRG